VVPADVLVAQVNPAAVVAVIVKVTAVAAEVIGAVVAAVVAVRKRKCKASSPVRWITAIALAARTPAISEAVGFRFPGFTCIPNRNRFARR